MFGRLVAGCGIVAGASGGRDSSLGGTVSGGDPSAALPSLCFIAKGVSEPHAQHAALWC